MRERDQWGDTDGNNGFMYDEFTPAELQAAWELEGMPYAYYGEQPVGSRQGRLEVRLDHEGKPIIGLFPLEIDAKTIKTAIEFRAQLIEERGLLNPPTIEKIREELRKNRLPKSMTPAEKLEKISAIIGQK